ncbi:MAG: hypothetical protein Tsb0020_45280 [Haliangiales bacterium]
MSVEVELISDWPTLLTRRAAWADLLARSSSNEPTLSPLWLDTWWRIFADDQRALRAVLVYRRGRLIGLVPLLVHACRHRGWLPLRRLEFVGSGEAQSDEIYSEYINAIAERGSEDQVVRAFVRALRDGVVGPWDELNLEMMDSLAPTTSALIHELRRARLLEGVTPRAQCFYIPLPDTWDAYLASLSPSRRYFLRRTMRAINKWGGDQLTVTRAADPAQLSEGIEILIDLHGQRWRQEGNAGMFASKRFTQFHRTVMPALLERGQLDLFWMSKAEQPLAAAYNIVWNDTIYFYQSGRYPKVPSKIRPGIAIHVHAIRHAIACGRKKYDFMAGATRYKRQLSLAQTSLLSLRARNPRSLAGHARALVERGEGIARQVRQRLIDRHRADEPADTPAST